VRSRCVASGRKGEKSQVASEVYFTLLHQTSRHVLFIVACHVCSLENCGTKEEIMQVSQALATCRLPGRPIRVVPEGSASESTADSDSRSRREPVARYKALPSSQIQPLFSPLLAPPPRLTEDSERGNGGAELGF